MYVCVCKVVTDRQIRQAVSGGARTVADLRAGLKVCTGCGCCAQAVEACLRAALEERARGRAESLFPARVATAAGAR